MYGGALLVGATINRFVLLFLRPLSALQYVVHTEDVHRNGVSPPPREHNPSCLISHLFGPATLFCASFMYVRLDNDHAYLLRRFTRYLV